LYGESQKDGTYSKKERAKVTKDPGINRGGKRIQQIKGSFSKKKQIGQGAKSKAATRISRDREGGSCSTLHPTEMGKKRYDMQGLEKPGTMQATEKHRTHGREMRVECAGCGRKLLAFN